MKSSVGALAAALTGAQLSGAGTVGFEGVVIDSRQVTPGCLFVALRGERFDSHDFLSDVIRHGAVAVLVERRTDALTAALNQVLTRDIAVIEVADSRVAFGEIGCFWRRQFGLPLIAVTGSNGKTTVKEMIAAILQAEFGGEHALSTQGNLNNDIGVPKTLFRLTPQHHAAVIEVGMNHPGEIAQLAAIALPTVGLVNNAQREHQEFMQSVAAVAQENGAIITSLDQDGVAVFPAGDPYTALWRGYAGQRRCISFGLVAGSDGHVSCTYQANGFGSVMAVRILEQATDLQFEVILEAAGEHNVLNALAAIAACYAIGCSPITMAEGLQNFVPVSGRLQKKRAHNHAKLLDDTYNANPDSVRAAIDVLAQAAGSKVVVLGDMGEVGSDGPLYHDEIGAYARHCGIDQLYTLGELARHSSVTFGSAAQHFDRIEDLLQSLDTHIDSSMTVLIKGSRFMKMERVVTHLMHSER